MCHVRCSTDQGAVDQGSSAVNRDEGTGIKRALNAAGCAKAQVPSSRAMTVHNNADRALGWQSYICLTFPFTVFKVQELHLTI